MCSGCVAIDVSLCSGFGFRMVFFYLSQAWEVVVTVVLIFHEAHLQLLIQAFEGTEIACWHQVSLIPYFL